MKRLLWILPLLLIAGFAYLVYQKRNEPPEVRFLAPVRERLVSTLVTNGKVEPLEWSTLRAEREGVLSALRIEKGQAVRRGEAIAELDTADARADLSAAESRIAQVKAELEILRGGGRARETAEIAASADRTRLELEAARREAASLERLVERKAATAFERDQAQERVRRAEAELRALDQRRGSLVSRPDIDAAEARLKEAETAAEAARRRIALGVLRAPASGVVYQLDVRKGVFLRAGDPLGQVGVLDRVRVRVYVDEPELGGVKIGQPVTMTWDAMPGQKWEGTVEKMPTEIVSVGTRQVGEVLCNIDNPGRTLIPGTNVTAELRLNVVEQALTVPKEVIRRENSQTGVFVLQGDRISWRPLKLGAASITRIQVLDGLKESDVVALPTEQALSDGMAVKRARS